jgi:predicted transcriptional regulator
MDVNLSPELEAKLNRKAAEQGRDSQSLIQEAVERLVDYDEWFIREVETGLAAADRGEFVEHDEVGKLIDSRYSGSCASAGLSLPRAIERAFATT